jgi:Xaa-Pro aminopeptidase
MPKKRLSNLRRIMRMEGLINFIVSKKENIHYLTGLTQVHPTNREALLCITPDSWHLYHSPFLIPPPVRDLAMIPMNRPHSLETMLKQVFNDSAVGFEADNLTVSEYRRFRQILETVPLTATSRLIENLRLTKDSREITTLKEAGTLARQTMTWVGSSLPSYAGHTTEKKFAHAIEIHMKTIGADAVSFPIIVAVDQNAADPHHQPGDTPITTSSSVLVDLGCQMAGYHSDTTRTFHLGTPSKQFKKVQTVIKNAYRLAVKRLSQPSLAAEIDTTARDYITTKGYGPNFIHTTGHGLGLEIHEQPSLNYKNPQKLKPGMVITIEPGIYLKGQFGYRHEDTYLLTTKGPQKLT